MAILEIVSFPLYNNSMMIFHSYVKEPEGIIYISKHQLQL